jgi:hypothetical protein
MNMEINGNGMAKTDVRPLTDRRLQVYMSNLSKNILNNLTNIPMFVFLQMRNSDNGQLFSSVVPDRSHIDGHTTNQSAQVTCQAIYFFLEII